MNIIKDPKRLEGTKQYRVTFSVKGKRKKRWFASRGEAEKFVADRTGLTSKELPSLTKPEPVTGSVMPG
mgnify:CR=1 FL=1